jgi:serine protease
MTTTHRTARSLAVLLIAVFALAIAAPFATASAISRPPQVQATHHIIWYRWHTSAAALKKREHKFGSKVVIGVESMQDLKAIIAGYGLDFAAFRAVPPLHAAIVKVDEEQLRTLLRKAPSDPRIRYVSPVHRKRQTLSMPNDPYLSVIDGMTGLAYEWSFLATHLDRALDITKGDPQIVVGIIDTGVSFVPDIADKVDSLWSVSGTTISRVYDSNDDYGHGTAVASLIAANYDDGFGMAGFGGETHVIGVHAGDSGYFNDPSVAVALNKLVELGVRVVNMSLGGRVPSDPILVDAIHAAAAKGVLLVASAGNDGSYVGWPAADLQPSGGGRSYGIVAGASDVTGKRASFSDYGNHVSLFAPGTYGGTYAGVLVALPSASRFDENSFNWFTEDGNHYGYIAGTSFSAPEVAGVAALIFAARPDLTNYQVADILKQSAQRTASDWTPGMGCGVLDAGAALELATSRPASAWADTPNTTGAVCTALGDAPATWPTEKTQTITFGAIANKRVGDRDFKVKAQASSGVPVSFTASGSCSIKRATVHPLVDGWCTITATQAGNAEFNVAQSVTQSFYIGKARPKKHHSHV